MPYVFLVYGCIYHCISICTCILTLLVCVSQDHKYMVQAEVLYKGWKLDESQLDFIHMLRDLRKEEMRGTYNHKWDINQSETFTFFSLLKINTVYYLCQQNLFCVCHLFVCDYTKTT